MLISKLLNTYSVYCLLSNADRSMQKVTKFVAHQQSTVIREWNKISDLYLCDLKWI